MTRGVVPPEATDPKILAAMQECIDEDDTQRAHQRADRLLVGVLLLDGHQDLVDLYDQVEKWFA